MDTEYLYKYENLDYLYNKCQFNKFLKQFLEKCKQYNVTFYVYDTVYNIYNINMIMTQIKKIKTNLINDHISKLVKLSGAKFGTKRYIEINNRIINHNCKVLFDIDKFIQLVRIIYTNDILGMETVDKYKTTFADLSKLSYMDDDISYISDKFRLTIDCFDEYK